MNISGKVAIITGGTRMGEAVARSLGKRGCQIILTWRSSRDAAEKTVAALEAENVKAVVLPCDVADPASIKALLAAVEEKFQRLHVLVHLASIYERVAIESEGAREGWEAHLDANAASAYFLTLAFSPLMKASGGGRVVHISDWTSASGRPRYNGYSSYYVSKAAVKAVTETLALELAPEILVNAIAPGPILAPRGLTAEEDKAVRQATPVGKWGGAEEIAKAVVFLIETDFVTGETLRVDGGRHLL